VIRITFMNHKNFVLSFDLPRNMNTLRVRVFRKLKRINATKVHDSLWSANDLQGLIEIALLIKRFGGSARILEEKFVF
ncbi:MAG: hypothetical protein J7K98_04070, partial [Candidatus Aenigmarchaeota archaeon]|nr:hypothetical protein [Candidatus Aenigmarchaeota archaeon]